MGTLRKSIRSSWAVPAAPTLITRSRSPPQFGQLQLVAAAPHQAQRGADSRSERSGPVQRGQRAWWWQRAQLRAWLYPSWGIDKRTGPSSKAFRSATTAVWGTLAPIVGSARRDSSSLFSHLIQGRRSLPGVCAESKERIGPVTPEPTSSASGVLSHWERTLLDRARARKTPPWDLARSLRTPLALA